MARAIHHSLKAVERYLGHFSRVVFLTGQGFGKLQTAFTIGISMATVKTYMELYEHHRHGAGFRHRLAELKAIGESHFQGGDEKKGALLQPAELNNFKQN